MEGHAKDIPKSMPIEDAEEHEKNGRAINDLLYEDVNGLTAGLPRDQMDYEGAMNGSPAGYYEDTGQRENQHETSYEIGMDGRPVAVGASTDLNSNARFGRPTIPPRQITSGLGPGTIQNVFGTLTPAELAAELARAGYVDRGPGINPFGPPTTDPFAGAPDFVPRPPGYTGVWPIPPSSPTPDPGPSTLPFPGNYGYQPATQQQQSQEPLIGLPQSDVYLPGKMVLIVSSYVESSGSDESSRVVL